MQKRADNFRVSVPRLMRKVGLVTDQVLVFSTPVDKGRARANWILNIDGPKRGEQPFIEGVAGSTTSANTSEALAQARGAIKGYDNFSTSIHISNNLPYIVPLDNGHSAQAPGGMSKLAIAAGKTKARSEFRRGMLNR